MKLPLLIFYIVLISLIFFNLRILSFFFVPENYYLRIYLAFTSLTGSILAVYYTLGAILPIFLIKSISLLVLT